MKKLLTFLLLFFVSLSGMAQLSDNDKQKLAEDVKRNYEFAHIEGASIYKTHTGYQVLVVVASSTAGQSDAAYEKARTMAAEFLVGAVNHSVTVYEAKATNNVVKEQLTDKIIQTSLAQVKAIEPLVEVARENGNVIRAYYLVISKTASKNGVAGFLSIIPGAGQFYKGSTGKGIFFLSAVAASAAGIIVCESTRSSYSNKAIEQPKFKKEYSTKADNWETARNICIGVGAAFYVWNIIDAFATKSARAKVAINKNKTLAIQPFATPQNVGMALSLNL